MAPTPRSSVPDLDPLERAMRQQTWINIALLAISLAALIVAIVN